MINEVAQSSERMRTSILNFSLICLFLIISTVSASYLAAQAENRYVSVITAREAERLSELMRVQLTVYEEAVKGVADVLHVDQQLSDRDFSHLNYRVLVQNPPLLALGWQPNIRSPENVRMSSLDKAIEPALEQVWQSEQWQQALNAASGKMRYTVSEPIAFLSEGRQQYLFASIAPLDAPIYAGNESGSARGFAFALVHVQKALDQTLAFTENLPAKIQILGKQKANSRLEIAALSPLDSDLSQLHVANVPVIWGDRELGLRLTPTDEFVSGAKSVVPWLVLLLGFVILALMVRLYYVLQNISLDQSARLRARAIEIDSKQRETEVLLDVAPVAILVLDKNGLIVGLSNQSIALERKKSIGQRFELLAEARLFKTLQGEIVSAHDNPTLRALRGEHIVNLQLVESRGGKDSYYSISASPVYDSSGHITGAVSVSNNVTDLVQSIQKQSSINEQLACSNRRLTQFASVASHDLQEPLRKICNFASLLEMEIGDQLQGESKQYLGYMLDGANRMSDLIQDILQYSEITPGSEDLSFVDLHGAIDVVKNGLSEQLGKEQVELTVTGSLPIYTSEKMLPLLLGNLINNAIKYRSEKPPRIDVVASADFDGVLLRVSDNGMGIPEKSREEVFSMFKRLHSKDKIAGTGIGLSICKQVVELSGGRIHIEESESGGCTFVMYFPGPIAKAA